MSSREDPVQTRRPVRRTSLGSRTTTGDSSSSIISHELEGSTDQTLEDPVHTDLNISDCRLQYREVASASSTPPKNRDPIAPQYSHREDGADPPSHRRNLVPSALHLTLDISEGEEDTKSTPSPQRLSGSLQAFHHGNSPRSPQFKHSHEYTFHDAQDSAAYPSPFSSLSPKSNKDLSKYDEPAPPRRTTVDGHYKKKQFKGLQQITEEDSSIKRQGSSLPKKSAEAGGHELTTIWEDRLTREKRKADSLHFDFAIVISGNRNKHLQEVSLAESTATLPVKVKELLNRLHLSGLHPRVETKLLPSAELKLILLLKADEEVLKSEAHKVDRERWLKLGGLESKELVEESDDRTITPADRIYLTDRILQASVEEGGVHIQDFNAVTDRVFPLHDDAFNRAFIAKWWTSFWDYFRDIDPFVQQIRIYYGERVALYFAYMDTYTKWLIGPSVTGVLVYFLSFFSEPFYFELLAVFGLFVSGVWTALFLRHWERRSSEVALMWGVRGHEDKVYMNKNFRGKVTVDPVTGELIQHYSAKKRVLKMICGAIVFAFFVVAEVILTIGFVDMYIFIKTGCGGRCPAPPSFTNWLLVLCQGILLGLTIDIVQYQIFRSLALILTDWENYRTEQGHHNSLVVKIFAWDYFGIYSWFWMIAFVYIPFGEDFVTFVNGLGVLPWTSYYKAGIVDLGEIFVTPVIVTQGLNMLVNTFGPWLAFQLYTKTQETAARIAEKKERLYQELHSMTDSTMNMMKRTPSFRRNKSPINLSHADSNRTSPRRQSAGSEMTSSQDLKLELTSSSTDLESGKDENLLWKKLFDPKPAPQNSLSESVSSLPRSKSEEPLTPPDHHSSPPAHTFSSGSLKEVMPANASVYSLPAFLTLSHQGGPESALPHGLSPIVSSPSLLEGDHVRETSMRREATNRILRREALRKELEQQMLDAYLDRVLQQSGQDEYTPFSDYADIIVQFGYVCQFSVLWPFIPFCGILNNLFEVRASAFKLCFTSSRPIPRKSKDIGLWFSCLRFSSLFSIFINLAVVCFASGSFEWYYGCPAPALDVSAKDRRLPPMMPQYECVGLFPRFACLIILEHVVLLIVYVINNLIRPTPRWVRQYVRKQEYKYKQRIAAFYVSRQRNDVNTTNRRDKLAKNVHVLLEDFEIKFGKAKARQRLVRRRRQQELTQEGVTDAISALPLRRRLSSMAT